MSGVVIEVFHVKVVDFVVEFEKQDVRMRVGCL
jgi:hypothetical protein